MTKINKYIPKTKEEVLSELKKIDKFGLLKVSKREKNDNLDEVLVSGFEEINKFFDENNRPPVEKSEIREFQLFHRLLNIMLDDNKMNILRPFDRHGLFPKVEDGKRLHESHENKKIDEEAIPTPAPIILGLEDKFGLLKSAGSSIFNIKNVSKVVDKKTTMPEEVATRQKCIEFDIFQPLFLQCQNEIKSGDRRVVPFRNEQDIKKGSFFIYYGLKCYVADVSEKITVNSRNNARLRIIFENGLEANMLHRSLSAGLYKDGRRILEPRLKSGKEEIDDDKTTGFIYILSSLNSNPSVRQIPNLHKIGFSTSSVEERIKNAKDDPTYLMAEVKIIASYRVGGIKAIYFENLIHKLFGHVQVELEIIDTEGIKRKPKEWFSVPYDVIDDVINLIENGDIINYVYDAESEKLIKK